MSRLPRLRSSSPTTANVENAPTTSLLTTDYVNTRKRKSTIQEEDGDGDNHDNDEASTQQPRKIAAIGTTRPVRGMPRQEEQERRKPKSPTLSSSNFGKGLPKTVTKPRMAAGPSTIARSTRGRSAPAVSAVVQAARVNARPTPPTGPAAARRGGRTVSSSSRPPSSSSTTGKKPAPPSLSTLQTQLTAMEEARRADADRLASDLASERSKFSQLQTNQQTLSKQLADAKAQELSHRKELVNFTDELEDMRKKHKKEVVELEMALRTKEREAREANEDLRVTKGDLERERVSNETLRTTLAAQTQTQLTIAAENEALKSSLSSLRQTLSEREATISDLTHTIEEKDKMVVELKKEVFEGETVRRKLHNMVLELKGNIRVMARVRPVLPSDLPSSESSVEELKANMAFPDKRDHKEIVLYNSSESAMGVERKEVYNFGFDRVFEPESTQREVFEEISQLAQSCIDGYNVCIFAYGQTGSGKSFTMEGGSTEATAGMIPRAVEQVFRVAEEMKNKGWVYTIEGQFLEIYNETIHDLLDSDATNKKKHEIKHDPKTGRTSVTDATVVPLTSPGQVKVLLGRAQKKRSVAATLMNERSSRSHSVFTLRISGVNVGVRAASQPGSSTTPDSTYHGPGSDIPNGDGEPNELEGTGERCEGCLNLVDLAGSERLNVSFGPGVTEKERVKETQAINKSLSALGDVIAALGERGSAAANANGREGHVPYRNSKLTYLLQNSLSGNSKTLMVLNLSPLAVHLAESLTSLRFATKVNNTQIGTAKKTVKS
ncbi:kinesin-domain-containing protein [Coprinopsis sp. MPI-PUGE-AT-0042]|nr:kinesin-domain-containing protein [Coprinopsis sp. MPI-PUGE-AT-0042]